MTIKFLDALEDALVNLKQPIVSDYDVFVCAYKLDSEGSYKGQPFYRQKNQISRQKGRSLIAALKKNKVIKDDPDFSMGIYRINELADKAVDEICALADPFCYLSHLTAMRRFGLTERISASLIVTTPYRAEWNNLRDRRIASDLAAAAKGLTIIPFKQMSFPEKIRGIAVHRHETKHPAVTTQIQDSFARISTIGATFADMLDKPALCGGMEHVLEVWQEHAGNYLDEIIACITVSAKKLVRVRAGYILDEVLNIKDDRVSEWLSAVQRGSSQVLDPEKPFGPTFSEKWMLSLNV